MIRPFNVFTGFIGIAIALYIFRLVRKDKLKAAYSVWWLATAVVLCVLGVAPRLFDYVGHTLGVSYPPMLALVLAFCLLLAKVLTMDIERSRHERIIRELTQRLALLEAEVSGPSGPDR